MSNPLSLHTLARTVFDSDKDAIVSREAVHSDAVFNRKTAPNTSPATLKIAENTDRKCGVFIYNGSSAVFYIGNTAFTGSGADCYAIGRGLSIFLPITDAIYVMGSTTGQWFSYIEV